MEVPTVVEGVACGIHIDVKIDKLGIEGYGFFSGPGYHAVYVHLVVVIPFVVEGIALIGILNA